MPSSAFVNRRWIRRAASGPVTSYLQVEKRSQMPVAVRTASYSSLGSAPSCIAQGSRPPRRRRRSCSTCQSCSGERLSSVMRSPPRIVRSSDPLAVRRGGVASSGRTRPARRPCHRSRFRRASRPRRRCRGAAISVRRIARPSAPSLGLTAGLVSTPDILAVARSPRRRTRAVSSPSSRIVTNRFGGSAATRAQLLLAHELTRRRRGRRAGRGRGRTGSGDAARSRSR